MCAPSATTMETTFQRETHVFRTGTLPSAKKAYEMIGYLNSVGRDPVTMTLGASMAGCSVEPSLPGFE